MYSTLNGNNNDLQLSDPHQFLLCPALYIQLYFFFLLVTSNTVAINCNARPQSHFFGLLLMSYSTARKQQSVIGRLDNFSESFL